MILVTPPAEEPVSLAEVKAQCRIDGTAEDTHLAGLITKARRRCESFTGRSLITQTRRIELDCWPRDGVIFLPRGPVQSISSFTYVDTGGTTQTLTEGTHYEKQITDESARLIPAYGTVWPAVRQTLGPIKVTYVCGYGDEGSDVEPDLRHGILSLIESYDRNRGDEVSNATFSKLSTASEYLFRAHLWGAGM